MNKTRDPFFDVVKAIAICLVVFCHVAGIAPEGTFPLAIENFRVGMNMSIFFIISGYFVWPTIASQNWKKLGVHLQSYFQPALFFSVAALLVGLCFNGGGSAKVMLRGIVVGTFVLPWFITTLAECYVCTFFAWVIGRNVPRMLCVIGVLIATIVFRPLHAGQIHFSCLINMLPCFLFGALVLRRAGRRLWDSRVIGLVCFAIFVLFVMLEGDVRTNGMNFYTADISASALKCVRNDITFILRPLAGVIGSIGVMAIIRIILDYYPRVAILAPLGTMTLGIYIFHLRPLEWMKTIGYLKFDPSCFIVVLMAVGLLAVSTFATWILTKKIGRFSKLIWGK